MTERSCLKVFGNWLQAEGLAEAGALRVVTLPSGRVDLVEEHRRRRGRLGGSV
jgi:hypothetical protein